MLDGSNHKRSNSKRKKHASAAEIPNYVATNREDKSNLASNASNYQYLQRLKQLCVFLDESEQEEFLSKKNPIDDPIRRLKPLNAVTMDAWLGYFKDDEGGRMKSKKSFDAFVSAYRYFFKKRKEEFSHGGPSVDPSFRAFQYWINGIGVDDMKDLDAMSSSELR